MGLLFVIAMIIIIIFTTGHEHGEPQTGDWNPQPGHYLKHVMPVEDEPAMDRSAYDKTKKKSTLSKMFHK